MKIKQPHPGNILIIVFLALTIFVSGFLYRDSFFAYFFQDDWFTLKISNIHSLSEFFQFFIPRKDVIYFRPLGMQMPFFILHSLFGINPLPFHILTFVTHAVNILLVFFLIRLIKKDITVATLCAFMYAVSAVFYIPMFWSATYAFILGPTLFFISFILFILSLQKKRKIYYILSVMMFFLGLLVNEIVTVLPIVLLSYQIFLRKIDLRRLLPYFLAAILLFLLRFFIFPPPVGGSYQINFGKEFLINLHAYFLWSFNWPEEMKAQFISLFKFNTQFIKDFAWYFWSFLITFFVSILLVFSSLFILIVSEKKRYFIDLFIFSLVWFVAGVLPVIFFTQHSFSYYLSISLVGLLLFTASTYRYLIGKIYKINRTLAYILIFILLANWIYSSFITIDFNSKVHWAPRRAKLSKFLVEEIKRSYPQALGNMVVVSASSENKLALNNQDALKIIYNNDNVITVYGNSKNNPK